VTDLHNKLLLAGVAAGLSLLACGASAGGFSRGNADIDILFEGGTVDTRDSLTYVNPNRVYDKKPGIAGVTAGSLDGREFSDDYFLPSLAVKYSPSENFACAATYTVSNGATLDNRGLMDRRGKLEESFTTDEYGMTCAVFHDLGPGRIAVIGGVFYEDFNYDLDAFTTSPAGLTPLEVKLNDGDLGWRAGVAYDVPDIGFRTSLVYRSGTEFKATGDADLTALGVSGDAKGWGRLPQSVELKAQTGIAPGWLAFGAVKWTDWSEMKQLHLNFAGTDFYNDYWWRDSLTLTAGIGHQFNDRVSGYTSLTWDRGVSTGWDLMGDTVTLAVGATIKDDWGGQLKLAGAAIWNRSVSEDKYGPLDASTKDSVGYAVQAQYNLRF
jgi:long-chain fatty acid transport protein